MPDPNAFVAMTHPDVHISPDIEPGHATRAAFDQVWAPKGWVLAGDSVPAAAPTRAPFTPPVPAGPGKES